MIETTRQDAVAVPTHAFAGETAGERPFVSVVVPTHRRRDLLMRLLHALRRQAYPSDRYEIIVVHNVTDDGTAAAVDALIEAGGRPALSYHAKNYASPTPSRQFGAAIARGTILAFIDDDCEPTPGWLAAGVAAFAEGIGVVQGCTLPRPDQPRRFLEKTVIVQAPTPYFETCNIFYRRAAFDGAGGFSAEFLDRFWGEDTDLGWKVVQAGWGRGFAPAALVHHEIFRQGLLAWHREALNLRVWPLLVRLRPAIREDLYCRFFVSRQSAAFVLFVAGLAGAVAVHPALLAAALPYPLVRATETGRYRNPVAIVARIMLGIPRAALIFAALGYGSLRYRRLVL